MTNDQIPMTNEKDRLTTPLIIGAWCLVIHSHKRHLPKEEPMNRRPRRTRGFTLMEILLVLAILVVLGSMVSLGYVKIQQEANHNAAKAQLTLHEGALNACILDVAT